ncbi:MAG: hypothetical protein P1U77_18220 [Rubripirellula sp.]|nr:hypothetical protein [Rubripirellula sp.]
MLPNDRTEARPNPRHNRPVVYKEPPAPTPHHSEPGTLSQQLTAIGICLYLADRRGTSADVEWQDARGICIPHARPTVFVSDPPSDLIGRRGE